jgi:hypothetical protein
MASREVESRLCRFEQALGRNEACPEARCPFWEPGGAVLQGRCAFDEVAISASPDVARCLLRVRRTLETARTGEQQNDGRRSSPGF